MQLLRAAVRHVMKDERKYYENLLQYSQEHLMVRIWCKITQQCMIKFSSISLQLYPYHLQDMLIKGLRVTPFVYYSTMMSTIMQNEKSYDSLPNFTAADCESWITVVIETITWLHGMHAGLRLMGIGRNQYIDLMNQYRSKVFAIVLSLSLLFKDFFVACVCLEILPSAWYSWPVA